MRLSLRTACPSKVMWGHRGCCAPRTLACAWILVVLIQAVLPQFTVDFGLSACLNHTVRVVNIALLQTSCVNKKDSKEEHSMSDGFLNPD